MTEESSIKDLIHELLEASEAYYMTDRNVSSKLTDEEFDEKLEFLENIKNSGNFEHLFAEGSDGAKLFSDSVSLGAKIETDLVVSHKVKMLSLKKAKTEEELKKFLRRVSDAGAESFNLQAKLDGFALSAHYQNGEIKSLATRGDGETGEDVSYLLKDSKITIVNLPETIDDESITEIRGEIFFTDEQFEKVNKRYERITGKNYKNSRNAVVGLMAKSRIGVDFDVEFTFGIYSVLKDSEYANISIPGVQTVQDLTKDQVGDLKISNLNVSETLTNVEEFGKLRKNFTIPTDGVVIKSTNDTYMLTVMGNSSTYPNHQIAFKYPGESAESTILDVDITVGRTGKVNPVARLDPVFLHGTLISNVSLHNFAWIAEKDVKIGSIVSIVRANDVIPYVKSVILNPDDTQDIEIPDKCPACGENLSYDGEEYPPMTLKCENENCISRNFYAIKAAVGKDILDIDGMSTALAEALYLQGRLSDISDLYSLTEEELSSTIIGKNSKGSVLTLGDKRAKKIYNEIQKSKNMPLYRFLMALSISGIGTSVSKDLVKEFSKLEEIRNANIEDLNEIDGIGSTLSSSIVRGLSSKSKLIDKLLEAGITFTDETESGTESPSSSALENLSFSMSGSVPENFSNRNEFVNFIEDNGGEFHSSPKKDTTYFIGDKNGSSSKIKKAVSLGIDFIEPENFMKFFNL